MLQSTDEPGNPRLAEARNRLGVAVAGGVNRYAPIQVEDPDEMRQAAEEALVLLVQQDQLASGSTGGLFRRRDARGRSRAEC